MFSFFKKKKTICHVVMENDLNLAKEMIAQKPALVNFNNNEHRMTPLHVTCVEGLTEMARYLMDAGADLEARDMNQATPLFTAVASNHLDMVKLLLKRGADVNATEDENVSPLHLSASFGHADIAEVLLDHGADKNAEDITGAKPRDLVETEGDFKKIIELLGDEG